MRTGWLAAGLLIIVGLVWIGQGTGLLQGTGLMVGDPKWAVAGVVLVLLGASIAVLRVRRRPGV
jgi:hypothetical protein